MNNAYPWLRETSGPKKPGKIWLSVLLFSLALPSLATAQREESSECYLEASESREISSILTGVIETVHVNEGQYVKKGQPLISLNSDVLEAQYEVAKAKAESKGRIMAAQAEQSAQSHRYGLIRGIGNDAEKKKEYAILQNKEGNLIAAKEDSKIFRLEAVRIRAELNERVIKSPIEGYVIKISKDEGEPVTIHRGDPNLPNFLIQVKSLSVLTATAFLPYKAIRHIKLGDKLTVASSDVDEEWQTEGVVEFINPTINTGTETVEIKVTIQNAEMTYKHGLPAKVIVQIPNSPSPADR